MGVWTGYDNLKDGTISGIGQQSAQLLYKNMMSYLMSNKENVDWQKPDSVIRARIIKNSNPPVVSSTGEWQLFVRGHAPAGIVDDSSDYDSSEEQTGSNSTQSNYNEQNRTITRKKRPTESQSDENKNDAGHDRDQTNNGNNSPENKPNNHDNDSSHSNSNENSDNHEGNNNPANDGEHDH